MLYNINHHKFGVGHIAMELTVGYAEDFKFINTQKVMMLSVWPIIQQLSQLHMNHF